MSERAERDAIREVVKSAISFHVQAVESDGEMWVDGIADATEAVIKDLEEKQWLTPLD